MPPFDPDRPNPQRGLPGVLIGTVVDNDDPEGVGRVRLTIPNVVEESGWAFPLGAPGGGSGQRGLWWVPPVGASVAVLFEAGDLDAPWYMPANWGRGEVPEGGDLDAVVLETVEFLVTLDDDGAAKALELKHKASGDRVVVDAGNGVVQVESSSKVVLKAPAIELGEGATEGAVLGTAQAVWLKTHTHLVPGVGASGVPVQAVTYDAPPGTHVSQRVKVKP